MFYRSDFSLEITYKEGISQSRDEICHRDIKKLHLLLDEEGSYYQDRPLIIREAKTESELRTAHSKAHTALTFQKVKRYYFLKMNYEHHLFNGILKL
jgi:hypothetical protein